MEHDPRRVDPGIFRRFFKAVNTWLDTNRFWFNDLIFRRFFKAVNTSLDTNRFCVRI